LEEEKNTSQDTIKFPRAETHTHSSERACPV